MECGSSSIAASFAGMLFADQGATVIKVEAPEGDRLRTRNPSGSLVWNRGKRSVVADLRNPAGQSVFHELVRNADVLLEAFGTAVMEKWDLSYTTLAEMNPRLVYCSIKGFASHGPYAFIKGYESLVAAKSGRYARMLSVEDFRPTYLNVHVDSIAAGHLAFASSLVCLRERSLSGVGQRLEASIWQASACLNYGGLEDYQHAIRSTANPEKNTPFHRATLLVVSKDGRWFVLTNLLSHQSQAVARALGIGHLLAQRRFATLPYFDSVADAETYESAVVSAARSLTAAELTNALLTEPDVAFEMIRTVEEVPMHPQVVHNHHFIDIAHPVVGMIRQVGRVARMERDGPDPFEAAPEIGEGEVLWGLPTHDKVLRGRKDSVPDRLRVDSPLEGITILEFGNYFAMPFGLTLAASFGARVIKVEGPEGDPWRYLDMPNAEVPSSQCTQGKESVGINLKSDKGRAIVRQLLAKADALVWSYRRTPDYYGLDLANVRSQNPRLVILMSSGYGYSGPYGGRGMYANTADAMSGYYSRQLGPWLQPDSANGVSEDRRKTVERLVSGFMPADGLGALGVYSALMIGLTAADRDGTGQTIETTMINSAAMGYSDSGVFYRGNPGIPSTGYDQFGTGPLNRAYKARSGWVFLTLESRREWERLVSLPDFRCLGRRFRFDEQRYKLFDDREADALSEELATTFAGRDASEWELFLSSSGLGCVEVYERSTSAFAFESLELRATGLTFEVRHPLFGSVVRHGVPATLGRSESRVEPGSIYGQHTRSILAELGFSPNATDRLIAKGVAYGPR